VEAGLTAAGDVRDSVMETERLVLRHLTESDVDAIFAVLGDPLAMKYYPRSFTREDAEGWVARCHERYRKDGYALFAVVAKADGEV